MKSWRVPQIVFFALLMMRVSIIRAADAAKIRILDRTTEPLIKADRPWEDFCVGYVQVIRDGGTWHGAIPADKKDECWLYYNGSDRGHDANVRETPKYSGGIGRFRIAVTK